MPGRDDDDVLFDSAVVQGVADEFDIDPETLRDVLEGHQSSIASLPGIENLVYEWRKQFATPVLERTSNAYFLQVPDWVWPEFGDALELDERRLEALVESHRRTVVQNTDAPPKPPTGESYVVLDRRRDQG